MPFILLNIQERLAFEYEGATIYYHRLGHDARQRVQHLSTERGQTSLETLSLLTCQEAIDAWESVYDADMHLVPVPPSGEGQRAAIASIVAHFPLGACRLIAEDALSDSPEAIKKRWETSYPDASDSSTDAPATSSLVGSVVTNGEKMG
jgi:hypothetical protein